MLFEYLFLVSSIFLFDNICMKKKSASKNLIKFLTIILTVISLLVIVFFIFRTFSGESKLNNFFFNFYQKNKVLTYFLFLVISPLVNLLPGISSMFFISLGNLIFNDKTVIGMIRTFIVLSISVVSTSSLMFLIGKFGGKKLISLLIDDKEIEKSKHLLTIGGKASLPLMYLLPGFPDDTLALVVGMTDMSFLYNFVCTILFRLTGVFTITFLGSNFIPFDKFTPLIWFLFILICIIGVLILLFITLKYYQYLRKKDEGLRYELTKYLFPKYYQKKLKKFLNKNQKSIDKHSSSVNKS